MYKNVKMSNQKKDFLNLFFSLAVENIRERMNKKKPTFFCLCPLLLSGLILQKRTKEKCEQIPLISAVADGTKSHTNKYNSVAQILEFLMHKDFNQRE